MERRYTKEEFFAIGEIQDELKAAQDAGELWPLISNMRKILADRDIENVLVPNGLDAVSKLLKKGKAPNSTDLRKAAFDFFNMLLEEEVYWLH